MMTDTGLRRRKVTSGVKQLDRLLGGLYIGDNVVWHDHAGSLATVFCMNLLQSSMNQGKALVYVSFDRSPRNLLDKLGTFAENPGLIILDCFTFGKGDGADVFTHFYEEDHTDHPCRIVKLEEPRKPDSFTEALFGIHSTLRGDVRFIFESITGMQDIWGGEESLLKFYSHSCPHLYELNTIAYWVMEKNAHSPKLRAQISQIAQVVMDLSIKRGSTYMTVLKAEDRGPEHLNTPHAYWTKDLEVHIEDDTKSSGPIDLGGRLRAIRTKRGLSQTELARLVGVTPSTISQVESNLIYPSLPALLKMAEILSVDVSSFFRDKPEVGDRVIFPGSEASEIKMSQIPNGGITARALTPIDFQAKAEPFLLELAPKTTIPSHFFTHKGEEIGYLITGKLEMQIDNVEHKLRAGDLVYLVSDMPASWSNPGPGNAKILWLKLK